MTRDEWLSAFATAIGRSVPTAAEIDELLELAGAAAHGSERQAAPISCWMAALAGLTPAQALDVARGIGDE